ncbi:Dephospho-CoA kinase cab5 [Mucor velutinosus]|uniref:Dephospho-CoA kinase cab5 n=1 Tax=Mucor velutinosus TaxID=708070 RepID=A0AAN7D3A1_9FUNG|nr:Dephospho-CoA kinase cab5 [Mucor velutinosus]
MPTLLTRTFALLNNIKPPTVDQPNVLTVINADTEQPIQLVNHNTRPDVSIWKAAELGDLAALQYYVHHTNSVDPTTLLNTRDPDTDCTLLHLVVSNNHQHMLPLIKLLLEHGADASARNVYNVQAIHMVSLHCPDPLASIELLLDHKASPNARDGDGWTPLHYAARFCHPPDPVIQLLIERGADVNLTDAGHKSPLFGLLANGDLASSLDFLVHTAKADVSIRGDFLDQASRKTRPGTIVLQAAKYGRLECLSLLIKSTVAMQQLRRVVNQDELAYAQSLAKEQQSRSKSTDTKWELILQLLQELEDTLEKDPLSLLSSRNKLLQGTATNGLPSTSKGTRPIQRRHTLMAMLGSMRRKKMIAQPQPVERKTSATIKLFRKMSRMMKRTKSDSHTMMQQPHQQEMNTNIATNNIRSDGMTR